MKLPDPTPKKLKGLAHFEGHCKTWTLDSGLDHAWTGLVTNISIFLLGNDSPQIKGLGTSVISHTELKMPR